MSTLAFTDRLNGVNGTRHRRQGGAVTDFTVLAFPTDSSLWRPQSRQIMTARPDQTGNSRFAGCRRASTYLAAVDPAEQGEWFEPAFLESIARAPARLTLARAT